MDRPGDTALRHLAQRSATQGGPYKRKNVKVRVGLFFGGAVENDADFFEGDEAAIDHFVEAGKDGVDALLNLDFMDDG